jgi:hypothetical protein
MNSWIQSRYNLVDGPRGALGYPIGEKYATARGGWIQKFEHGVICDSPNTQTSVVSGWQWTVWQRYGRETGVLGYPNGNTTATRDGWIQIYEHGAMTDSNHTSTQIVTGWQWTMWQKYGREDGVLGYPTSGLISHSNGWVQVFQGGALTDSDATATTVVLGTRYTGWVAAGRETGILKYPTAGEVDESRGISQTFQGGELWALGTGAARRVYGAVLTEWKNADGATGSYGYPTTDTTATSDGRLTCTFEGGTITA